jgi:hypothetical protein
MAAEAGGAGEEEGTSDGRCEEDRPSRKQGPAGAQALLFRGAPKGRKQQRRDETGV